MGERVLKPVCSPVCSGVRKLTGIDRFFEQPHERGATRRGGTNPDISLLVIMPRPARPSAWPFVEK